MKFFYTTQDFSEPVSFPGGGLHLKLQKPRTMGDDGGSIPSSNIYCGFDSFSSMIPRLSPQLAKSVLFSSKETAEEIVKDKNFPKAIKPQQAYKVLSEGSGEKRVAIFNAIGTGMGDSLIGMRALEILVEKLAAEGKHYVFDMYCLAKQRVSPLMYRPFVDNVYQLPSPLALLHQSDYLISIEHLLLNKSFNQLCMIDFFLRYFGLNPAKVDRKKKRNHFAENTPSDSRLPELIKVLKSRKTLLIHTHASDRSRAFPPEVGTKVLQHFVDQGKYNVVVCHDDLKPPEGVFNLAPYTDSLKDFIYVISQMDAIISADTCCYHIADAFSVPTVAVFTTIPPHLRASYYPTVRPLWIGEEFPEVHLKHKGTRGKQVEMFKKIFSHLEPKRLEEELEAIVSGKTRQYEVVEVGG